MYTAKTLTWDFSKNFTSCTDPRIEEVMANAKANIDSFVAKYKNENSYLEHPAKLLEALKEYETLKINGGGVNEALWYLQYSYYTDTENTQLQAKKSLVEAKSTEYNNELEFFTLNIARIEKANQPKFLEYKELEYYRYYLSMLFNNAKYNLSEKEEKIINLLAKPARENWEEMVEGFLSKVQKTIKSQTGQDSLLSFEGIMSQLSSQNKEVRDSAAGAINEINDQFKEVATWELNSIMETDKIINDLRGVERFDTLKHIRDGIESEVVDTLVECVTSRFDIPRRFYKLKAKIFGVEKLAYHERNLEYKAMDKEFSYDYTTNILYELTKKLHPDFHREFVDFVEQGRIDVYPKKGKRGGAFCTYNYTPKCSSLILLNYTNKLRDVTTYAHEMGHGINHRLMYKNQSPLFKSNGMFRAETASTFLEDLTLSEIEKELHTEKEKLGLLLTRINANVGSIFRQIACENLQRDLNYSYAKDGFLSTETISDKMNTHMAAYMGDYVSMDAGSENWWVYWSHIRGYSLYSYVSGLIMAKSMQKMYRADNSSIEKIVEWYKTGNNISPKESFEKLNIDISSRQFWLDGLDEIDRTLTEAEELFEKINQL